jgi:D-alanyl-lipoteichoic acid acyltransferase DltB (MBOAT superfamily)
MLFNSYEFIFGFFPLCVVGFFLLQRCGTAWQCRWLAAASLVFYGYWDPSSLPVLLSSLVTNYVILQRLFHCPPSNRSRWFTGGVVFNLSLLGYFKYASFLLHNANFLCSTLGLPSLPEPQSHLPIGVSFFTFTQIALLADAHQRLLVALPWDRYLTFITYFPHLIAGPILHPRQILPQLDQPSALRPSIRDLALGAITFSFGLAKKVLVADTLAPLANAGFGQLSAGMPLSPAEAWQALLAYTLQIYFDFSGYCEMAIGLSLVFGINLPINFSSPYRASSIIDFWHRWHQTLSRFLRDYLYFPLGGNRHGPVRRYRNLMLTMVIGGLWHGASWTFILWGAIHGMLLLLNHAWRALFAAAPSRRLARCYTGLTFLAVTLAWVPFRAPDLRTTIAMYGDLAQLPTSLLKFVQTKPERNTWGGHLLRSLDQLSATGFSHRETIGLLGLGLCLCFLAPPLIGRQHTNLTIESPYLDLLSKSPLFRIGLALTTALAFCASLLYLADLRPFLYFRF